jgi:hypothetical protein
MGGAVNPRPLYAFMTYPCFTQDQLAQLLKLEGNGKLQALEIETALGLCCLCLSLG